MFYFLLGFFVRIKGMNVLSIQGVKFYYYEILNVNLFFCDVCCMKFYCYFC